MKYFLTIVLFFVLSSVAHADSEQTSSAKPSNQDKVEIAAIEKYLNNLKSISANFLQIDDQGGTLTGKIAIQRPGKMRVDYDAPSKDFIVADGSMVHIWNSDINSQTNVDEGSSLAVFILQDPIQLSGNISITRMERFPAKLELTLEQTHDPAAGSLTLIFEEKPLILRQWRVRDPEGHVIGVSLQNMREDVTFPDSTFNFVPPTFGKGGKAE